MLLQEDLGFSKLVVTDSLTMAGLAEGYWAGDAALRAFKAGVDVLLGFSKPGCGVSKPATGSPQRRDQPQSAWTTPCARSLKPKPGSACTESVAWIFKGSARWSAIPGCRSKLSRWQTLP